MSDANEFVDVAEPGADAEPSALRAYVKTVAANMAALRKEYDKVKTKLDGRTATDLFTDLKLSPKLAGLYKGEVTKEAITAWAAEYADVFGTPSVETPVDGEETPVTPPALSPDAAALAAVQHASHVASGGGQATGTGASFKAAAQALLDSDKPPTPQAYAALMAQHGFK